MLGKQCEFLLSLFCLPSVCLTLFHSANGTSLHCRLVKGCLKEMVHKNFIKDLGGNGKSSKSVKTSYSCAQVRQLATLAKRKTLSAQPLLPGPRAYFQLLRLVWHAGCLGALLWAPPAASVHSLPLGRSWGLWSAAQIPAGSTCSIPLPLPLCSLSLTDLQPGPHLSRGLGLGERLPLAIPRAALLEHTFGAFAAKCLWEMLCFSVML